MEVRDSEVIQILILGWY